MNLLNYNLKSNILAGKYAVLSLGKVSLYVRLKNFETMFSPLKVLK